MTVKSYKEVYRGYVYDQKCIKCKEILDWTLVPDPDSLFFYANCCDVYYTLTPRSYVMRSEEVEEFYEVE